MSSAFAIWDPWPFFGAVEATKWNKLPLAGCPWANQDLRQCEAALCFGRGSTKACESWLSLYEFMQGDWLLISRHTKNIYQHDLVNQSLYLVVNYNDFRNLCVPSGSPGFWTRRTTWRVLPSLRCGGWLSSTPPIVDLFSFATTAAARPVKTAILNWSINEPQKVFLFLIRI